MARTALTIAFRAEFLHGGRKNVRILEMFSGFWIGPHKYFFNIFTLGNYENKKNMQTRRNEFKLLGGVSEALKWI